MILTLSVLLASHEKVDKKINRKTVNYHMSFKFVQYGYDSRSLNGIITITLYQLCFLK